MPEFKKFKKAVSEQFAVMSKSILFVSDVSKDELWDTYLASFRPEDNPIFRERTEHDCQHCKRFIRACGGAVAIDGNKLVSIWDVQVGGIYQPVADALSALVKSEVVRDIFIRTESIIGTNRNNELNDEGDVKYKWEHFYFELPQKFVMQGKLVGSAIAKAASTKEVFKRGLSEITIDAFKTVLELIDQDSIYRGAEYKKAVKTLYKHKKVYDKISEKADKDNYCWYNSAKIGGVARTRNSLIGTLLCDISEGKPLDEAVRIYESNAAPENYKRPKPLITKKMIDLAQKKVEQLGISDSLFRRYATIDDITHNNILFANRTAKKAMNVFDELADALPDKPKNLSKVEEVSINKFVTEILPKVDDIKVLLENKHENNLMSLISPTYPEAKGIFKWNNNFSWVYNLQVADSMRKQVAKAGGDIHGVLRFSIRWNDQDNNQNDFDAHCREPKGNEIYYSTKHSPVTLGRLDVNITNPGNNVAVENITWPYLDKMEEGQYTFSVKNFSHNGGKTGFSAEIEYDGMIHSFVYDLELRNKEVVTVAKLNFTKTDGIKFLSSLNSTSVPKEMWGLSTEKMHKVSVVMRSPNHWDGNKTGNKHYFFMLENCKNNEESRGFFNEFLKEDLNEHRKVFEVLGSKMKAKESESQLSGLGFSSTKRNSIICKVSGAFTRTIKINF